MEKVKIPDFLQWTTEYFKSLRKKANTLRLGQKFIHDFFPPEATDDFLFYEENNLVSIAYIYQHYISGYK